MYVFVFLSTPRMKVYCYEIFSECVIYVFLSVEKKIALWKMVFSKRATCSSSCTGHFRHYNPELSKPPRIQPFSPLMIGRGGGVWRAVRARGGEGRGDLLLGELRSRTIASIARHMQLL